MSTKLLYACGLALALLPGAAGAQIGQPLIGEAPTERAVPAGMVLLGKPVVTLLGEPLSGDTVRSVPAAAAEDGDSATAAAEEAASALQVDAGSVRFAGLVQAWYSAGEGGDASTFRLRRAEMKFAGELDPRVRWVVMVDPAKALKINHTYTTLDGTTVVSDGEASQSSLLLQDAYMTFRLGGLELDAGQFRLPLSLEGGVQSSATIESVERAMFISRGKYGLVRDLGVMLSGSLSSAVDFQVGAFNGVGEHQNSVDADEQKTLAGRVVVSDVLAGLHLGASGAWSGEEGEDHVRRDRLGLEGRYVRGPLTLRSEWMRGWDGAAKRVGYYALAAYRLGGALEVSGRYDVWDAGTRLEDAAVYVRERDYVGSLSYFLSGPNARIQASLVRRDFGPVLPAENLLQVNFQTSW